MKNYGVGVLDNSRFTILRIKTFYIHIKTGESGGIYEWERIVGEGSSGCCECMD